MPNYSIIVEVIHTRAYDVYATSAEEAQETVRQEYTAMPYDTLEEEIDSMWVEENG